MYKLRLKLHINSGLTGPKYMNVELENFGTHVQTHRVNSDPKHGRLKGHDFPTARSINILRVKNTK
jgi:hypothetical protein